MQRLRSESVPALVAGLLILMVAAILLVGGGVVTADHPFIFDLWLLVVALVIVFGALLASLLAPTPSRSPEPVGSAATASSPNRRPDSPTTPRPAWDESEDAGGVGDSLAVMPVAPAPAASPRAERSHESIPAAWAYAADPVQEYPSSWPPLAPPSTAALPFYAAVAESPFVPLGLDARSEIDRLRARVRELETPSVGPRPDPAPRERSTTRLGSIPEPPALRARPGAMRASCAGCGHGLSSTVTNPLCWGCGRELCGSCYWRYGEGPGLHRCPACYGRAGSSTSAARSGAHLALPVTASAGAGGSSEGAVAATMSSH